MINAAIGAVILTLVVAGPADALGSLSVTVVGGTSTVTGTVASTLVGTLTSATWSDTTLTGHGWNGTLSVSDLTYTGTWSAVGSAPVLLTTTSAAFTDTADGVTYTVTTGTITSGAGSFIYTSTDSNDASGAGTVSSGTPAAVGTKGLTISFGSQTVASGSVYRITAGTESAGAVSLNPSATGAAITPGLGTLSPAPVFVGAGTTVTGGGVAATAYGTGVKFVSAAVNTGEGTYTVIPGVSIATDATSWAATYTAGIQYAIVSGP